MPFDQRHNLWMNCKAVLFLPTLTLSTGKCRHHTISLDVNSERDAGGVIVSYERHAWESVLADIKKVISDYCKR